MDCEQYLKRLAFAKNIRNPWIPYWQDVATYIVPKRAQWDIMGMEAKMPEKKYYDYFPISSAQTCADGIQGYSVMASLNWLKLLTENIDDYEIPGVADWLEESEKQIYAYLRRSSFYEAIADMALDGPTIGTATLYYEFDEEQDRFLFSCRHPREIFIIENRFNIVDTVYREFSMTALEMVDAFDSVPSAVSQASRENPFQKFKILHSVQPRVARDREAMDSGNMPFESVYIDISTQTLLRSSGYRTFPFAVWRFRKNPGELYGRGIGVDVLPDVLRLNNISKDQMDASHKAVDPPMNIPRVIEGQERLVAGGRNYYVSPSDVITPIHTVTSYPLSKSEIDNIRGSISKAFFNDFFLTLQNVDREMTAREVVERQGERAAILSPVISRFNNDLLDPVIKFVFSTLYDMGKLPPPPSMFEGRLKVDFIGPLAQAQKKYHQYQGIFSGYQAIAPLMQVDPTIMDNLDMDILTREAMNATGMPQKVIREAPDVQKIRQARAEAQQQAQMQQQEMQAQEMLMKNANKLNAEIVPDSPLDSIVKNLGSGIQR